MSPLLIKISKDFATLWTTIDPIGNVALFAGLTASLTRVDRHWTALRACIYATIILVVAVVAGQIIETRSLPTLTHVLPPVSTCRFSHLCRTLPDGSVHSLLSVDHSHCPVLAPAT
jgi:hypothetical protein